ncbi:MAG: tetratricopeptide repeat protein [Oceanicaulis sp.]
MTRTFDLDAELAAGREAPKRTIERERGQAGAELARALDRKPASGKTPSPKAVGLLRRAMKTVDTDEAGAAQAARLCLKALDPDDAELYMNLGLAAWKLDMLEAAEKFLRLFHTLAPTHPGAVINLAGLLRDLNRYEDSIEILRAAIYADPDRTELWNALGTSVLESGDPEGSEVFYLEALRLNPNFARSHHNLGFAYDMAGRPDEAAELFARGEALTDRHADRITMTHARSLALLSAGRLDEGWEAYESRLDRYYKQATEFLIDAPRWDGIDPAELKGKRVLAVGEQGLGDEVAFASLVPDLTDAAGPEGGLTVATEKRLAPLFQRSFPGVEVLLHKTVKREGRVFRITEELAGGPPDIWLPIATAHRAFRRKPEDFPTTSHIKADPARVAALRAQLAALGPGPKIGLLWRSLKMDANRAKYFAAFETWRPVIETPGVTFVNLQYGDVDAELEQVKKATGVEIRQIEGLDLKADLDGVAALGVALDLTIGPMNASTNLSAGAGGNTWILHGQPAPWTLFGTGEVKWYPASRSFRAERFGAWDGLIRTVAVELARFAKARAAA